MAIRPPLTKNGQVDLDKIISKGAHVMEDTKSKDDKKWTYINLRVPSNMLEKVDEILEERVGITRTGWILEAIQEKLKRMPTDEY